jgi:hypothetical protein
MEGDLKRNETVSPMAGKTPSQFPSPQQITFYETRKFTSGSTTHAYRIVDISTDSGWHLHCARQSMTLVTSNDSE